MISPTLNVPQARFLSMPHKFKAYIAGFGSGKTWVGCGGICKGIWEHPGINQGYFAPTYPQIRDIFYPTVEEVAADWGLNVKINEGNKEVHFYYGRQGNDSNLLIVFYVQIMPDDFVMQLHR
ncbi:terminase large subunit domain-containing protein, partial [Escherichia coli]|uniref:terminase large subunit domain-containing protein n=1 Tax=Escherichia coli TaxID=562 RepID=UPI002023A91A